MQPEPQALHGQGQAAPSGGRAALPGGAGARAGDGAGAGVGADRVLIAHIDGRRFLSVEQRAALGYPSHSPKYDAGAPVASATS